MLSIAFTSDLLYKTIIAQSAVYCNEKDVKKKGLLIDFSGRFGIMRVVEKVTQLSLLNQKIDRW